MQSNPKRLHDTQQYTPKHHYWNNSNHTTGELLKHRVTAKT